MGVVDFNATRFANDAVCHAKNVLKDAENLLDDDPMEAGILAVEAWVILNAAAITAKRVRAGKILKEVEGVRKNVMCMGASLNQLGYSLQTDIPESAMAVLVRGEDG